MFCFNISEFILKIFSKKKKKKKRKKKKNKEEKSYFYSFLIFMDFSNNKIK